MEHADFLDTDPPHWAARGLAWLLIALFAAALAVSMLVRVPETVASPFVLVPVHGSDPVRASQDGVVTEVRITEGATVKKGDTLYVMRADPIGDRSSEIGTLQAQMKGTAQRQENVTKQYESERRADDQETARLTQRLADLERLIGLKKNQQQLSGDLDRRYDELSQKGYVSREGAINRQLEAVRIAQELQQAQIDRDETRANLERLHHQMDAREVEHAETVRGLQEENDRSGIRIRSLQENFNFMADGSGTLGVRAPCDGTVLRQSVKGASAAVLDGDTLCELACASDQLQAELAVSPSQVGRLQAGQGVKLLYDAFPYQRYGVRFATVRWISPATVQMKDVPTFRVLADVADRSVQVEGRPRELLAGMGGTAQVVIGSRTLLGFALEPVRAMRESLVKPPETGVSTADPRR